MGVAGEDHDPVVMSGEDMPEMNASKRKPRSGNKKVLFSSHIETALDVCPLIENYLDKNGIYLVQTQDLHARRAFFDEYFPGREQAECRLVELRSLFRCLIGARRFYARVRRIAEVDWSESWKKSFHTARISRRIVIRPSWESFRQKRGDCVVTLDPGMSFGTGLHPTTRACLRFIDRLAVGSVQGKSFLDAGCGSGVLAIAAAKLGFSRVMAVDYDPLAVKAAKENCRRNRVSCVVECVQTDLLAFRRKEKFDVVAANMFESEHARFMANIVGAVTDRSEGCLLIAGTLLKQYPEVVRMYGRGGFSEKISAVEKGWKSGMLIRQC